MRDHLCDNYLAFPCQGVGIVVCISGQVVNYLMSNV